MWQRIEKAVVAFLAGLVAILLGAVEQRSAEIAVRMDEVQKSVSSFSSQPSQAQPCRRQVP